MANGESRLVAEEDWRAQKSFSDLTIIHQKKKWLCIIFSVPRLSTISKLSIFT